MEATGRELGSPEPLISVLYCIIFYLNIYIALLTGHNNQKRFQGKILRERRAVLRERKEALGSPVNKVNRVEGGSRPTVCFKVCRAGLTMLQVFQLKRAYPQTMNFRGLPWYFWFFDFWLTKSKRPEKWKINKIRLMTKILLSKNSHRRPVMEGCTSSANSSDTKVRWIVEPFRLVFKDRFAL